MLKVNIEYKYGVLFVRICGNLDIKTKDLFLNRLIPMIKQNGIKNLVYNFEELKSIDEIGYVSLLKGYNEIINNHGNLIVVNNKFKLENFKETNNELSALKILKI